MHDTLFMWTDSGTSYLSFYPSATYVVSQTVTGTHFEWIGSGGRCVAYLSNGSIIGQGVLDGQTVPNEQVTRWEGVGAPVPPQPDNNASLTIYDDAIALGWNDWSSNTTLDPSSTIKYAGTYGLGLTYGGAWARLYLAHDGIDTTPYQSLSFYIHGGSTGGQSLYASLYDENNRRLSQVRITPYVQGGSIPANAWRNVRIPLADLGATGRTITGVRLMSASATTVTLDDVEFNALGASEAVYKNGNNTGWSYVYPLNMHSVNALATPIGKIGSYAFEANFAQAWAGFEFRRSTPIDTRHKRALVFRVKGIEDNDIRQLYVGVRDANNILHGWLPFSDWMITPSPSNEYNAAKWYTVTIPLSAFDAENMQLMSVVFMTGEVITAYLDEIYLVEGLKFPLKRPGDSAYATMFSSVLDHVDSNSKYNCRDEWVVAYTGEVGHSINGESRWSRTTTSDDSPPACVGQVLRGYAQDNNNGEHTPFSIKGQYDTIGQDQEEGKFLFYDGHTGYDYPATDGTPFYPVADGVVDRAEVGTIVVNHGDGYKSYYLHNSVVSVNAGDKVRVRETKLGETGGNHLHLTLMLYNMRVDPYGWTGTVFEDPSRAFVVNVPLWK